MERIDLSKISGIKRCQVNEMIKAARKYPFVRRLIIFGSSVTDCCTEESDIDVCMDVGEKTDGLDLFNFHADICKICDYNCDVLNYHRLKGRLKNEIDEKGVVVYACQPPRILNDRA